MTTKGKNRHGTSVTVDRFWEHSITFGRSLSQLDGQRGLKSLTVRSIKLRWNQRCQNCPLMSFAARTGRTAIKGICPKKLKPLIGRETLYRQLEESFGQALRNLPKVHAEIEALFLMEGQLPANRRAIAIILRAALGDEVA